MHYMVSQEIPNPEWEWESEKEGDPANILYVFLKYPSLGKMSGCIVKYIFCISKPNTISCTGKTIPG